MDFTKIKKYPSQISATFKRFPLATAFAFFTFIAYIINYECVSSFSGDDVKTFVWLGIYPIAAMLIALATSLFQESQKSKSQDLQIITSSSWLVISITLTISLFTKDESDVFYFASSVALVYIIASLSIFFAPFWKQKDENGFWNFLQKSVKAIITAAIVSTILLGALEGLLFGFAGLFDANFSESIYFYILIFCSCTVFPILSFTGIPSIDECLEEEPSLNKFTTSTIRFLFIPVLAIGIVLFYAYIVKFILQWDMPDEGTVSAFVFGFMIYMLTLITVMYPAHLVPNETLEKRLLKIFPAACIPLVVLMSIDTISMLKQDIEEENIYITLINVYFYAVIAILLIGKIKRKFRYIALIFCALFFIFTDTPLNAINITRHLRLNSIEKALIEQGYKEFPLSEEEANKFIEILKKSDDQGAQKIISRIKNLDDKYLAHYFSGKVNLYGNTESCCSEDSTEKFDRFEASVSYAEDASIAIPKGANEVIKLSKYFNDKDFEYLGDTLSFRITIEPRNKTDETDSTQAKKIYSFKVLKQSLKQDSIRTLTTEGATIGLHYIYATQRSETNRSLRIKGLLFME